MTESQTQTIERLVAFSEHRPEKIAAPVKTMNVDAEVVTVETADYGLRRYIRATWQGCRAVFSMQPNAILADHFGPLTLLAVLLGALTRTPVVVRSGGNPFRMKRKRLREAIHDRRPLDVVVQALHTLNLKIITALVAGYFVVSESLREEFIEELGWGRDKLLVTAVPVDVESLRGGDPEAASDRLGVTEQTVLLTVSNLSFELKYDALAAVAPDVLAVLERHRDAAWVIAGDGEHQGRLVEDLNRLSLSTSVRDRVYLSGYVDDIEDIYALADVFVYFSAVDGYPNVVLEAQANELPVVANPDHGIVEQVEDDVSGLLVEPDAPNAVEESLDDLLDDEGRRHELGRGGFQRIVEENTPETIGKVYLERLETVVGDST